MTFSRSTKSKHDLKNNCNKNSTFNNFNDKPVNNTSSIDEKNNDTNTINLTFRQ